jgi:hypothetical protein
MSKMKIKLLACNSWAGRDLTVGNEYTGVIRLEGEKDTWGATCISDCFCFDEDDVGDDPVCFLSSLKYEIIEDKQ